MFKSYNNSSVSKSDSSLSEKEERKPITTTVTHNSPIHSDLTYYSPDIENQIITYLEERYIQMPVSDDPNLSLDYSEQQLTELIKR